MSSVVFGSSDEFTPVEDEKNNSESSSEGKVGTVWINVHWCGLICWPRDSLSFTEEKKKKKKKSKKKKSKKHSEDSDLESDSDGEF